MQKAVVDRFVDGKYAVLLIGDKEEELNVSIKELPEGTLEGTWLKVEVADEQLLSAVLDHDKNSVVKKGIQDKMAILKKQKSSKFQLK